MGKSYGRIPALRGADFVLEAGTVLAIVGENGAGKSTLVKVLAGLNAPYSGEVSVNGKGVSLSSARQAERAGIAVVSQELSVLPNLTVGENILVGMAAAPRIWTRRGVSDWARPHLAAVGLDDLDPSTPASSLSIAQRQLVELARTLAREARIIVLDEPTAAMGDDEIAHVKHTVRRLAARGCVVIYVSHRLAEVLEIADAVMVVRNSLAGEPSATTGLKAGDLVEKMLGKPMSEVYPPPRERVPNHSPRLRVSGLAGPGLAGPISLDVAPGEIVGLAGQTGSGASELLKLLAGRKVATEGTVTVDGRDIRAASPHSVISAGIAYVSPDRKADGIFPMRSARQNLSAALLKSILRRGVTSERRESEITRSLGQAVAFDETRLRKAVDTLSGGNQQKVVIGRWFGADTRVLLIDEPTRGVDVGARAEIYQAMRRLTAQGTCIIFASSDVHEVLGAADRVLTFYRGSVVGDHATGASGAARVLAEITHAHNAKAENGVAV